MTEKCNKTEPESINLSCLSYVSVFICETGHAVIVCVTV